MGIEEYQVGVQTILLTALAQIYLAEEKLASEEKSIIKHINSSD